MFHFLGFIIFGLIVGLLARAITPGRDSMGWALTCGLGILGSMVGGWLGRAFGWYGPDDAAGFIAATVGAVIVLSLYNIITGRRASKNSSDLKDIPRRAA